MAEKDVQNENGNEEQPEEQAKYAREMRRSEKAGRPCYSFRDTGGCRRGKTCQFSHNIDVIQDALNKYGPLSAGTMGGGYEQPRWHAGAGMQSGPGPAPGQWCAYCSKNFDSKDQYELHLVGKQHKTVLDVLMDNAEFTCKECLLVFDDQEQQQVHEGAPHEEQQAMIAERRAELAIIDAASVMDSGGDVDMDDAENQAAEEPAAVVIKDESLAEAADSLQCDICNLLFAGADERARHVLGKKHLEAEGSNSAPALGSNPKQRRNPIVARCDDCDIDFEQKLQFEQHLTGKKHATRINKLKREAAALDAPPPKRQNTRGRGYRGRARGGYRGRGYIPRGGPPQENIWA